MCNFIILCNFLSIFIYYCEGITFDENYVQ